MKANNYCDMILKHNGNYVGKFIYNNKRIKVISYLDESDILFEDDVATYVVEIYKFRKGRYEFLRRAFGFMYLHDSVNYIVEKAILRKLI